MNVNHSLRRLVSQDRDEVRRGLLVSQAQRDSLFGTTQRKIAFSESSYATPILRLRYHECSGIKVS